MEDGSGGNVRSRERREGAGGGGDCFSLYGRLEWRARGVSDAAGAWHLGNTRHLAAETRALGIVCVVEADARLGMRLGLHRSVSRHVASFGWCCARDVWLVGWRRK